MFNVHKSRINVLLSYMKKIRYSLVSAIPIGKKSINLWINNLPHLNTHWLTDRHFINTKIQIPYLYKTDIKCERIKRKIKCSAYIRI